MTCNNTVQMRYNEAFLRCGAVYVGYIYIFDIYILIAGLQFYILFIYLFVLLIHLYFLIIYLFVINCIGNVH